MHKMCHKILDYSEKPDPRFFRLRNENPDYYIGVELEVGGGPDKQGYRHVPADLYYVKADGSIPDYGFEVVSHPATLQYHKHRIQQTRELFQRLTEHGYKSHDIQNCGLHVHVDKDVLTNLQWIKLDFFIHHQVSLMEDLARRNSDYGRLEIKPLSECGRNDERRVALNFWPEHTNEFRMFRGTLKVETYIATLELVDILLQLGKTIPAKTLVDHQAAREFFLTLLQQSSYDYAKAYVASRLN